MKVRAGAMRVVLNKHNFRRLRETLDLDGTNAPEHQRPITRGDCIDGPRPCPWVGCRHHLALEVTDNGNVRLAFGFDEDGQVRLASKSGESCSLDVADGGPRLLDAIGEALGVTREYARVMDGEATELLQGKLRRLVRREHLTDQDLVHAFGPSRGPF